MDEQASGLSCLLLRAGDFNPGFGSLTALKQRPHRLVATTAPELRGATGHFQALAIQSCLGAAQSDAAVSKSAVFVTGTFTIETVAPKSPPSEDYVP